MSKIKLAEILLIEDNEGDIILTTEAFEEAKFRNILNVVKDGDTAIDYLMKRNGYENSITPDIILLDLNLPGTDGKEVLETIKNSDGLKRIPTVILTSSSADKDIIDTYNLYANCYITKPIDSEKFLDVIKQIKNFWVDIVCLPNDA